MYTRLLNFPCCPQCNGNLEVFPLSNAADAPAAADSDEEISEGLPYCEHAHRYPVRVEWFFLNPLCLPVSGAALEAAASSQGGKL